MVGKTSTPAMQEARSDMARRRNLEREERLNMIREAAYYRFMRRGYAHGFDLEDWLAAEAELFSGHPEPGATATAAPPESGMQQRSTHSPREDEVLKRIIKKHPQRDIPQIEGIDPQEAPLRE